MTPETIIRAWKDPEFRASLTSEQRAALPELPSGKPMTELDEGDLSDVVGGVLIITRPTIVFTVTRPPTIILTTRGSAVDACPSALGCTTTFTIRQTTVVQTVSELG
jgi:mersacidin/lichenicidin family type 2 lantibiotic